MRLLGGLALALLPLSVTLFLAGAWRPEMAQHGVAVALFAVMTVLTYAALEHLAAQRRAIVLEAWESRLKDLEAREQQLRAEVDTLNRERALNRM